MSFSERDINAIHSNTTFVNGKKYFGEHDNKVTSKPTTERFVNNQDLRTDATIFIPVMERIEKLDLFLKSLKQSIDVSKRSISLVILDNSIERKQSQEIKNADFGSSVTEIYYHHDPRMSQSGGRNFAFNYLSANSGIIGIWDADIYASENTVNNLIEALMDDPVLSGIAPPLGKYGGGSQELALSIYKNLNSNKNTRLKLHMPGKIGEENGVWRDDVLRTTMMRGSFFISARELGFDFGYLMQGDIVVLHDDRVDPLSVGYSLEYRTSETLKSIFMLMYRNDVFLKSGRETNRKFLDYNISAIERVTGLDNVKSVRFQDFMLNVATSFDLAKSPSEFEVDVPKEFEEMASFIELLKHEQVFNRIKKIKSNDSSRPLYTV